MNAAFNQIQFEETLIDTLVRRWKMGRRGRKTWSLEMGFSRRYLRKIGFPQRTAEAIVNNCKDMAALLLDCEGN